MKRITCILTVALLLTGCGTITSEMDAAMELRQKVLAKGCSFTADITADYGDELYCFQMECSTDTAGTMTFTVTEPTSIAGITGTINANNAKLKFDGTVLSFPTLADGRIVPAVGPWAFINTLRSGYISACGKVQDGFQILADDSYADNSLQLEIFTDTATIPLQADIFWNQQKILSIQILDFVIL